MRFPVISAPTTIRFLAPQSAVNLDRLDFVAPQSVTLPAAASDGAPTSNWMLLVPKGRFHGRDGRGPYEAGDAVAMQAIITQTLAIQGATELMVDYDHQLMFGAVPGVGGQAKASGWVKEMRVTDRGIEGRIEWTDTAAQSIRAREYRYLSPVYRHDQSGRILSLHSVGLVNAPNLDLEALAAFRTQGTEGAPMLKEIAKALGLAETATEAEILAAMRANTAAQNAIARAAGLQDGATSDAILTAVQSAGGGSQPDPARFVPIAQLTAVQSTLATLQTSIADDKAVLAVDAAIKDGKLVPAMRDWGLSLHKADAAAFTAFVEKAPVLTAPQLSLGAPPKTAADPVMEESDLAVMRQMGLDPAAYATTAKALREGAR